MKMKMLSVVVLAALVGGCDFFNSQAKRAEIIKLEERKAERVATEKKDAALALKAYIEGKCKLVEADAKSAESKLSALEADSRKLETAIAQVAENCETNNLHVEERLLLILKDPCVNDIAQKYLSVGFSSQRETYGAKLREMREKEDAYAAAVDRCNADFDAAVSQGKNWVGATKEQRDAEIRRLEREINMLEKKRHGVRRSIQPGSRLQERERQDDRNEYDREIRRKRAQIDFLRAPDNHQATETQAVRERQNLYEQALSVRRRELQEIDRRMKQKVSIADVVKDAEAMTLGELRKAIVARRNVLSKGIEEMNQRARIAKDLLLEVLVTDGEELQKLRVKVDKQLSMETRR